jgi:periplasmic divalent cation tolerance protein
MTDALVVLITSPNEEHAAQLARTLVGERLLACANLVPRIRSIYAWQGQVHDEAETLLVCKTRRGALGRLEGRVKELHPYDTPEVLALPVEGGSAGYLAWLEGSVAV